MRPHYRLYRPALPLVLLLIAALACSITASEIRIDNARLFSDPEGVTGTRNYQPDQTFYARADLRKAPDGATVEVIWRAVDVGADHAAYEIARESVEVSNGPLAFELAPPAEGWTPGNYTLAYVLNGDEKLTLEFMVKGLRE